MFIFYDSNMPIHDLEKYYNIVGMKWKKLCLTIMAIIRNAI